MGCIIEVDDVLSLEHRSESFYVLDLKRKYPSELPENDPQYKVDKKINFGEYKYQVLRKVGREYVVYLELGRDELKAEQLVAILNEGSKQKPRGQSDHIFAYKDGEIEVSKVLLQKLVGFFDDPEHRKMLEVSAKSAKRQTAF